MTQPTLTPEALERRAAEQRQALHKDVQQLWSAVRSEVRERIDLKRNVSRYFTPIAGVIALAAFSLGYGLVGSFTRD